MIFLDFSVSLLWIVLNPQGRGYFFSWFELFNLRFSRKKFFYLFGTASGTARFLSRLERVSKDWISDRTPGKWKSLVELEMDKGVVQFPIYWVWREIRDECDVYAGRVSGRGATVWRRMSHSSFFAHSAHFKMYQPSIKLQ